MIFLEFWCITSSFKCCVHII